MVIEKNQNEIVIRVPNNFETEYLQKLLDYLSYKDTIAKSNATDQDINQLSEEIKGDWWQANKANFIK
jgi:hypothetical protein